LVEPERVQRRAREIGRRLGLIDALLPLGREILLADANSSAAVERHLQIAIQAAIDIAVHLLSEDVDRTPESYGHAFRLLVEPGVLAPGLAARLSDAAGLRNILVHDYLDLDPDQLWSALQGLDDLREFTDAVQAYLDRGRDGM